MSYGHTGRTHSSNAIGLPSHSGGEADFSSSSSPTASAPPSVVASPAVLMGKSSHHSSSGRSRERQKTMSSAMLTRQTSTILKSPSTATGIAGVVGSMKEEDSVKPSPAPPRPQKFYETKQGKTMDVIMTWSKMQFKVKILTLSSAFYLWKYTGVSSSGQFDDPSNTTKKEKMGEQKNAYLLLFAENEKLREQLNESRRSALTNEKAIRDSAVKNILGIIFRSRLTSKKRYYFDHWLSNTRADVYISDTKQRATQLEVGLQRVESERKYVQTLEHSNAVLKQSLALTVCFFKWKGRAAQEALVEERNLYEKQRKLIFHELVRIRKTVANANKEELAVMNSAVSRGDEMYNKLEELRRKLEMTAKLGKCIAAKSSNATISANTN